MLKIILYVLLMNPLFAHAFSCGQTNDSYDLDYHWNARKDVFVARVISGVFDPETNRREYIVEVERVFKGSRKGTSMFITYYSYQIRIGENYLFMLPAEDEAVPNECIRITPFEFSWENRDDIIYSKDVRRILELSNAKP